jgi:hypothetical protein
LLDGNGNPVNLSDAQLEVLAHPMAWVQEYWRVIPKTGGFKPFSLNPAQMLVGLASSMRNDDGLVLIEGFEKGLVPLTELEKAAVAAQVQEVHQQGLSTFVCNPCHPNLASSDKP